MVSKYCDKFAESDLNVGTTNITFHENIYGRRPPSSPTGAPITIWKSLRRSLVTYQKIGRFRYRLFVHVIVGITGRDGS